MFVTYGKIKVIQHFVFCSCSIDEFDYDVFIPEKNRNFSLQDDIVKINIFPLYKWTTSIVNFSENILGINEIKKFFNQRGNVMNYLIQNKLDESDVTQEAIKEERIFQNLRLIPVGEVLSINNPTDIEGVTGIIECELFYPDDDNLPIIQTKEKGTKRVIGTYNRKDKLFIPQVKNEKPNIPYNRVIPTNQINTLERKKSIINEIMLKYPNLPRINITSKDIITIDSTKTSFLDDAIHFSLKENNHLEIGIHCTDYSDEIDIFGEEFERARKLRKGIGGRSRLFNYQFLESNSLRLGKKSKAFSIIFDIDLTKKEIVHIQYGKTIILIKAQLTFEEFDLISKGNINNIQQLKLYGLTLDKLKSYIDTIIKCGKLLYGEKYIDNGEQNTSIGEGVIHKFGNDFNRRLGCHLQQVYGDVALIKKSSHGIYASFRSPLRKFNDLCVLRQIESMARSMSKEDMTLWVCGVDNHEFKRLFDLY
ncbi:RNB family domain containing protein [Entamoeba histolytica HM-1:IMSS-B]|uniref:RNB domain-containing protein n=6 Tax=Entamoeba histolytica TaxID=5759 RepID=C4LZ65_ENTH1|nr:hypothetical protein EHI_104550 [Entamoeba histolytica HM-1:IMSS]EMD43719.1 RNB family protein [Entamoeba histolytica KU27]EMH73945.1 RNB family domain containing protein [Entamoeba histolytica HM-1:IMSS-B]EMS12738.1 RNB family domain containing protein [Entamoeba histolytica HM-3:IMSS]ENY60874.1 RNB family domain containing protein [Entamoeba histolytica HM-1:IMSS-A]GAT94142.1 hypothetical protein CL6EHI_104550 [Entamoeba histolytica]|eukprot:XP_655032.1 hypothetical protein EHI_104550 [Entamoeba histolytica HM-1:IMSS]